MKHSRTFGLIGRSLQHSFSKGYFTRKFEEEHITGCTYRLFELSDIKEFETLIKTVPLAGLNVTIPYKEQVMTYLHKLDISAEKVGAVNVIRFESNGQLTGFNSDYYGFKTSLENWLLYGNNGNQPISALILGTGGASKAVSVVLKDLGIPYKLVSRSATENTITYKDLNQNPELVRDTGLIINTTPLGMYPQVDQYPDLPYNVVGKNHFFYDLVYNPETTLFMEKGFSRGASVKNGLDMLHLQAEKSWEIWSQE